MTNKKTKPGEVVYCNTVNDTNPVVFTFMLIGIISTLLFAGWVFNSYIDMRINNATGSEIKKIECRLDYLEIGRDRGWIVPSLTFNNLSERTTAYVGVVAK